MSGQGIPVLILSFSYLVNFPKGKGHSVRPTAESTHVLWFVMGGVCLPGGNYCIRELKHPPDINLFGEGRGSVASGWQPLGLTPGGRRHLFLTFTGELFFIPGSRRRC